MKRQAHQLQNVFVQDSYSHNLYDDKMEEEIHNFLDDFFGEEQILLNGLNNTTQPTTNYKKNQNKNLPDSIGTNFRNYAKKHNLSENSPAIEVFLQGRDQNPQSKTKISELQSLCFEPEAREHFKTFLTEEYFLYLLYSNKVANPVIYSQGIGNYVAAADSPEQMKGNYLLREEKK